MRLLHIKATALYIKNLKYMLEKDYEKVIKSCF